MVHSVAYFMETVLYAIGNLAFGVILLCIFCSDGDETKNNALNHIKYSNKRLLEYIFAQGLER